MHFAIIGDAHSTFLRYLEENTMSYVIFTNKQKKANRLEEKAVYVSFEDSQSVFEKVRESHSKKPFTAAVTMYEQYIVVTAKINDALSLPGLGEQAAVACTNKSIMRALFAKAPTKISPDYQVVTSLESLTSFADSHSFPLILKPANLAKSLLVMKCRDKEELLQNYELILERIERVYKKYAPHNERLLLVEEFMEGSIHSVDAFVDGEGNPTILPYIVDYRTGFDVGFDDNFHYSRIVPTKLSEESQKEFLDAARIGIQCLGMKNSAAHVEIIVTNQGPRIVEIGARNGGYRERMHAVAHGIDIYGNLIRIISGQPLKIDASKNEPCAVLELFPKRAGTFQTIQNLDELKNLPSLTYLSVKFKPGEYCGKSSEGYKASCVIMLHNSNPEQFNRDLAFIDTKVVVVTE